MIGDRAEIEITTGVIEMTTIETDAIEIAITIIEVAITTMIATGDIKVIGVIGGLIADRFDPTGTGGSRSPGDYTDRAGTGDHCRYAVIEM